MLDVCESEDRLCFAFEECLDTAKCNEIEEEMRRVIAGSYSRIVFDLEKVRFVSSAFLRLCIHAYQQAKNHDFRIIHVDPLVKRVFKIAGMDAMLGEE